MQEITTKFLNQKITFSLNEDKFNIFFGENARGGSVIFEEKEISENLLLRKLCMDNNVPDFVGYLADKYTLETKLYELKKILKIVFGLGCFYLSIALLNDRPF